MNLKTYYGSTIREALDTARRDLGSDAVVVTSRQVSASEGLPGSYEVVCGTLPGAATNKPGAPNRPATVIKAKELAPPPPPKQEEANPGISAHLKKSVRTIRAAISGGGDSRDDLSELKSSLLISGFSDRLGGEILSGVRTRLRGSQSHRGQHVALTPEDVLRQELDARLSFDAGLGRSQAPRRITALVGPPGIGKTSLIVKLAVRYGLRGRKPLRLVSLDGARVGGADALRTYAAGMAVPIDVLETGMSLSQTLEAHPEAGLILIDTPGLSPAEAASGSELARSIATHPEIDVQLVLSASMSPADLKSAWSRFKAFHPSRVAVTSVDSAVSGRGIAALAIENELSLSFVSTGPRIPEDLEEASAETLLGFSSERQGRGAVSAA